MKNSKKQFKFVWLEDDSDDFKFPHGDITYLIAFFVPILVLIALYYVKKAYPFGEECYLRSDMYHQYAPFFRELFRKLRTGQSLTFSWDIGMGVNFTALMAYYLASPINWIIVLFPEKYTIEVMNSIMVFKAGLSSVAFTYYIVKHFKSKSCIIALFGLFYAISGYYAAYNWNLMWLDCIIVLPLIMLGLELLVNENKFLLYTFSLGFCIFTNYYISIMVCISIVLYFVILMFAYDGPKKIQIYIKKFINFCVYSALGGGLAACLLLPVIYAFSLSASSNSDFPKILTNYFTVVEMLCRHLMNIPSYLGLDHHPNIYCGVFIFILFPLYIINTKVKSSEKVGKVALLIIFLLGYNLNIPDYIWHGMHFPNSLPARQSFIYIFFLLTMCYEGVKDLRAFSKRQLTIAFSIAAGLILFIEQVHPDMYEWKSVYMSGAFIFAYIILMLFYHRKKLYTPILLFLVFATSIVECTLNMENIGLSMTSRTAYTLDNNAVANLMKKISADDTSFYRIEKTYGLKTKNDAAWHGYRSISTFSSTAPAGITNLLGDLGCEHSMNAYAYSGSTLFTASMFNVKYIISNKLLLESNLMNFYYGNDGEFLYQNHYTLPVGYMVSKDIESNWDTSSVLNGIEVQNSFAKANTGIEPLFEPVNEFKTDIEVTFTPTKNAHYYAVIRNVSCDTVTANINNKMFTYSDLKNNNRIVDIGYVTPSDTVTLTGDVSMNAMVYALDTDKFIQVYNLLNAQGLNVTKYSDTLIKGNVNVANDGIMFFSIPYDGGWNVKVDGKPVKTFAIKKAVLGIELSEGTHIIEMKYSPVYRIPGILITLASLLILIALTMLNKLYNEKRIKDDKLPIFLRELLSNKDIVIERPTVKEDNEEE